MPATKIVAFVLFDDALALNIAGPAEVFGSANRLSGESTPLYELVYLSTAGGLVRTSSGVSIHTQPIASVCAHELDTVIVVGGVTVTEAMRDQMLIGWIARTAAVVRRTCSVCTGAFLLAAAHLLDGRRAVTHWSAVDDLLVQFPDVDVQLDPIYVNDGNIWTSAGISAGIDLALTLVEGDRDRRLSLAVARDLVVFLHRPGGQAQFSRALMAQADADKRSTKSQFERLHGWIVDHLDEDLSVERLAARVKMTPRTFARKFVDWHGRTPAKLIEDLRLETACRHLEENQVSIKQVAWLCGFGDEERMRRVFMRRLRVPPLGYREQFAVAAPAA
ncbi:GlxA family transcriptional regulator [Dyella mobilis]|uniref:DJ-1/PfpI family protein n=1 Tax=Dyella mobilis TaxID=1849582 RepID=A0ABS2KCB4_9GAMM|nr:helix-turn-helix domain-containing protein [Dyella mobilis]MBM7128807.1 DJ-1/PfpI family protein [Dyella mobilis]